MARVSFVSLDGVESMLGFPPRPFSAVEFLAAAPRKRTIPVTNPGALKGRTGLRSSRAGTGPADLNRGCTLASWAEVRNYIQTDYQIQNDTGTTLTLVFNTGDGRSQLVFVMGIEDVGDLSSVRYFSPFARVGQISPTQFANLAGEAIFGLAELADMYGVVHNSFLENLDASEIDTPLMAVTSSADAFEKRLGLGDEL